MDPISGSCYDLNTRISVNLDDDNENEIWSSHRSISQYEDKNFKSLLPQILAAIIAISSHLSVGIAISYSTILLSQLEDDKSFNVTKNEGSWIVSVFTIVSPIGATSSGFIMDSIGRLNTIKLSLLPTLIGWTIIAMAYNLPMLIIGRLLTGLASALATGPAVVYVTEIARADMRASLISFAPAFTSIGMMLGFLQGWLMSWSLLAWTCNIYAIITCLILLLIPESPVWLVSKSRVDEAKKSLTWIHKYQSSPNNNGGRYKTNLIELQLNFLKREHEMKLIENRIHEGKLFRKLYHFLKPTGYKPLLLMIGLFFFQQFSGIFIFLFYAIHFFEEVGSTMNPYFASIFIGLVRVVMSLINTYVLSTFRRRPLVILSSVLMALCTFFAGLFAYWIKEGTSQQTWAPVVFLILFVLTSMIGLVPIPFSMTAELFPIEIRGIGQSLSISIANFFTFLSVQVFGDLEELFNGIAGTLWFFTGILLVAVIFVFVFLPETHGKKLKEIEEYFKTNTMYLMSEKKKKANDVDIHNVKRLIELGT